MRRAGDAVVLSKPLGTGLVLAGGTDDDKAAVTEGMRRLNRAASEALRAAGPAVHAVTDVTGYGLAGHGWEVAERSGVRLVVDAAELVAYPGALEAAERGVRTGGDARNRDYVAGHLDSSAAASLEALVLRPADLRRPARRRRPRPWCRPPRLHPDRHHRTRPGGGDPAVKTTSQAFSGATVMAAVSSENAVRRGRRRLQEAGADEVGRA